jgi:hypothetical protein
LSGPISILLAHEKRAEATRRDGGSSRRAYEESPGRLTALPLGVEVDERPPVMCVLRSRSTFCSHPVRSRRVFAARQIRTAARRWRVSNGKACPSLQDLATNGLEGSDLLDPWGTQFSLTCGDDYEIVTSAGPDRSFGTDDDGVLPRANLEETDDLTGPL